LRWEGLVFLMDGVIAYLRFRGDGMKWRVERIGNIFLVALV
jgi:hypothetical protein